jgi:hypothetical protein
VKVDRGVDPSLDLDLGVVELALGRVRASAMAVELEALASSARGPWHVLAPLGGLGVGAGAPLERVHPVSGSPVRLGRNFILLLLRVVGACPPATVPSWTGSRSLLLYNLLESELSVESHSGEHDLPQETFR